MDRPRSSFSSDGWGALDVSPRPFFQKGRDRFFVVRDGLRYATPLFIVVIFVELTDLIFAVDSIPAVFAVTQDPFIVLTSATTRPEVPRWDSFAYVTFIVAVEGEFGIKFPLADVESFQTVGDIVNAIKTLRHA